MVRQLLWLVAALPSVLAGPQWIKGASFAGKSSAAVFPLPHATPAPTSFFPAPSLVGFAGPTQTGDEAEAIATALPVMKEDTYPLSEPQVLMVDNAVQDASFNPARFWGNMAPYFSVDSAINGLPGASPQIPSGCELTQVHLFQRHGSRYPTSGDPSGDFTKKLMKVANSTGFNVTGPLAFLDTWTFKLGQEILTAYGRKELFDAGAAFRMQYGELLKGFNTSLPVFRTTSEERMVQSAVNFAAGMFGIPDYLNSYQLEVQIEENDFNITLAPWNNCPNANGPLFDLGTTAQETWEAVYLPPAVSRIQQFIQGVNLTVDDAYSMQNLCVFETLALGFSEFCGLFTEEEWRDFEYSIDVEFWYSDGPGNPQTAPQGIGYVQEMVARLTNTPMNSSQLQSSLNMTWDGNNVTFPLHQPIYFDFSHDTVFAAIISTMNITNYNTAGPMPITSRQVNQTYFVQNIAPFAANLVGQVMTCPANMTNPSSNSTDNTPHIRWILNDGVLPLTTITTCEPFPNKDGLCPLDAFLAGMNQIIAAEDWQFDCFANQSIGVPNNIVDGKFHPGLSKNITLP